jgi:hypothetical protein
MDSSKIKSCFVIIGYGEKVDPLSQRRMNLDRVYENIIKPVFDSFDEPKFDCFRACDKNFGAGVIDVYMYKWILEADFVIADISTLNPNAIYELGIRHALRPFSTLVIAEDGIREFPFDINHVKIEKYKHLGEDIGVGEAKRFTNLLKSKIQQMLNVQSCDSPIYTYIDRLKPPYLEIIEKQSGNPGPGPGDNILEKENPKKKNESISLTELISRAETEMKVHNYKDAIRHFTEASKRDRQNLYLKQRMILATYRSGIPDKESALMQAKKLLEKYFDMKRIVDRHILELSGTICRDLAEIAYEKATADALSSAKTFVKQSAIYFQKAYVIADDLGMGSKYGYVLVLKALLEEDLGKKYSFFTQAILVWQRLYAKFTSLYTHKKTKNPDSKNNPVFLEIMYEALIVLSANRQTEEIKNIKEELKTLHDEQEAITFYKWLDKLNNYTGLVRKSLANYRPEIFI